MLIKQHEREIDPSALIKFDVNYYNYEENWESMQMENWNELMKCLILWERQGEMTGS